MIVRPILLVSILLVTVAAAAEQRITLLEFPRLNDTFRDFAPEIMPGRPPMIAVISPTRNAA